MASGKARARATTGGRDQKPRGRPVPKGDLTAELGATGLKLQEALEQQAAISQILRSIAGSPTEHQPVPDAIAESAARFCAAEDAAVILVDGDKLRTRAHHGPIALKTQLAMEFPLTRGSVTGRSILDRRTVQVADLQAEADDEFPIGKEQARRMGHRTTLASPLLREGAAVGAVLLRRMEVRPFTEHQIELVRTFADQAVIAIENVRLFNETKEALERQIATSEVLKVISSSAFALQPVLQVVIEKATRLCDAQNGFIYLREGDVFYERAGVGPAYTPELHALHETNPLRVGDRGRLVGRVSGEGRTVHIPDVLEDPDYTYWEAQRLAGFRSSLGVPLLREGGVVGVVVLWRTEPRPFEQKQIDIVSTFADQAVIAIENARLYGTIERQRAELRRFLSPQVAALITAPEGEALLKGHRREITVVFCDLRGFTAFSETADPEEALAVVRTYHETLGPLIVEHGGTLEHFEGDGVMVFFNDPVPIDAPVLKAVKMATAMRARMSEQIAQWKKRGYDLGFGCGIATGYATLGRIGFEGRYDYGAIGPVTNLASRLSSEAKAGQILLSQRAFAAIEDLVEAEPMGEIDVKGYSRPQPAYDVMRLKEPAASEA